MYSVKQYLPWTSDLVDPGLCVHEPLLTSLLLTVLLVLIVD